MCEPGSPEIRAPRIASIVSASRDVSPRTSGAISTIGISEKFRMRAAGMIIRVSRVGAGKT
jgi:hypothetical protein